MKDIILKDFIMIPRKIKEPGCLAKSEVKSVLPDYNIGHYGHL